VVAAAAAKLGLVLFPDPLYRRLLVGDHYGFFIFLTALVRRALQRTVLLVNCHGSGNEQAVGVGHHSIISAVISYFLVRSQLL